MLADLQECTKGKRGDEGDEWRAYYNKEMREGREIGDSDDIFSEQDEER